MNINPDSIVFSIQSSVIDLFESIEHVTTDEGSEKQQELKDEAQRIILMLIAAIVLEKGNYDSERWSFLSNFINWQDLPGGEIRYLNEYASRWSEGASNKIPEFFEKAVQYDLRCNTAITRSMLRHIQSIGNTICAADGTAKITEQGIVRKYIALLEERVQTVTSQAIASRLAQPSADDTLEITTRIELDLPNIGARAFSSYRRNVDLRWIPPGEAIDIEQFHFSSGMIYVSEGQASVPEASAINLQLPIGLPSNDSPLNYYPIYSYITPEQRAVYLGWLAAGRSDEHPESRELGYVFIFFYGLERRLLIDKAQDQEVVAEIVRLLHHYGPYTHSRSLQSYAGQLIHFWGWQQGTEYYSQLLEWMKTLPVSLLSDEDLSITLAGFFQTGKLVPADLAYEIASRDFESRRSVVVSRVNKEFRTLFAKRFGESFPQGLQLSARKRPTTLYYRPASPTLLHNQNVFRIQIPDVAGLQKQFQPLVKIWNSCIQDLAGYSRAKSKPVNSVAALDTYLALPDELKAESAHPLSKPWEELMVDAHKGKGCTLIETGKIAQLLDIPQREKLTPTQSRALVNAVESLGFGIEPDARRDGAYDWNQEIAVYKPITAKITFPSENYRGASVLLKLCVLVAGADGHVAPEELEVSRRFIEKNLTLSLEDKQRLDLLEQILVSDPLKVKGELSRIAAPVPQNQRELICEVLVYVAAADNVVTKDEIRMLARIFKAFDLSNDKLEANLKSVCEFKEVTIQTSGSRIPGEPIPQLAQPFRINMARVEQIAKETSEVIGILSKVMVDTESENKMSQNDQQTAVNTMRTEVFEESTETRTIPGWMESLDVKYRPILLNLIERDSWPRTEFDGLAKKFQLMPLNVFDAINEWADESLGDFILEGDDPIVVHKGSINDRN